MNQLSNDEFILGTLSTLTDSVLPGIFFQNKVDYATWFGWRYDFIHGIQMLPVTPALLMIRTPEFCRQELAPAKASDVIILFNNILYIYLYKHIFMHNILWILYCTDIVIYIYI